MKRSLFMYLFLVSAVITVFTFVYYDRQAKVFKEQTDAKLKKANDSILTLYNNWVDAEYFSLDRNQNAQDYLNTDVNVLIRVINDEILGMNTNPAGNPLVPYDAIDGKKFLINKVKVLNHRWIICDFSNGDYWGEVMLKYFIEEDQKITFNNMDAQLYQKQK